MPVKLDELAGIIAAAKHKGRTESEIATVVLNYIGHKVPRRLRLAQGNVEQWSMCLLSEYLATNDGKDADMYARIALEILLRFPKDCANFTYISALIFHFGNICQLGHKGIDSSLLSREISEKISALLSVDLEHGDAPAIASTIVGLEKLLVAGVLDVTSAENISTSVVRLIELTDNFSFPVYNIANLFWGLGKLAEAGFLKITLTEKTFKSVARLLTQLNAIDANAQNLAVTLWGLGIFAEVGILSGVSAQPIAMDVVHLIKRLSKVSARDKDLAGSIFSLGKLSVAGVFAGMPVTVMSTAVLSLLDSLDRVSLEARAISNVIFSLGKIAERKLLNVASVEMEKVRSYVIRWIELLSTISLNDRDIAYVMLGLGGLAEAGILQYLPASNVAGRIILLVKRLSKEGGLHAQDIANVVWGIGKLAETEVLTVSSVSDAEPLVIYLAEQLDGMVPVYAQDITNTIWSLRTLAIVHLLNQDEAKKLIKKLYTRLPLPLEDVCSYRQVAQSLAFCDLDIPAEIQKQIPRPRSSVFHSDVSFKLANIGCKHEDEYSIGGCYVDIFVPDKRCVIELDGDDHEQFAVKCRSVIRDRWLIEKCECKVIRIATKGKTVDEVVTEILGDLKKLPF